MKIILEIHTGHDQPPVYHRTETFPVTLGRGYDNDIILQDMHISAAHARIDLRDGRWVLTDLGSLNGTFINDDPKRAGAPVTLNSGDRLRIGELEISVYSAQHPIDAAVKAMKARPWLNTLQKPLLVWGLFALALATLGTWTYLETWSEEVTLAVFGTMLMAAGIAVVWAGLWSVVGRLLIHKSCFRGHLAFISLFMLCSIICWYVASYITFLTSESWISVAIDSLINMALLAFFVFGNLALATKIKSRRRLTSSFLFAIGLIGGALTIGAIASQKFNPYANYPSRLLPYLSELTWTKTSAEFMEENRQLFDHAPFTAPAPIAEIPAKK